MLTYLEKLRKKPYAHKRRAVLIISLSIMFVIVSVWIVTIIMRINAGGFSFTPTDPKDRVEAEKTLSEIKGSWSDFLESVNKAFPEEISTTTETVL